MKIYNDGPETSYLQGFKEMTKNFALGKECLMLKTFEPSVLLGKTTNYSDYIENNPFDYPVYRGAHKSSNAIINDENTLWLTYVIKNKTIEENKFNILKVLKEIYLDLGFENVKIKNNDVLINNRKVTGTSTMRHPILKKTFTVAIVNFQMNFEIANQVAKMKEAYGEKFEDRVLGIWQHPENVKITIDEFKDIFIEKFKEKLQIENFKKTEIPKIKVRQSKEYIQNGNK